MNNMYLFKDSLASQTHMLMSNLMKWWASHHWRHPSRVWKTTCQWYGRINPASMNSCTREPCESQWARWGEPWTASRVTAKSLLTLDKTLSLPLSNVLSLSTLFDLCVYSVARVLQRPLLVLGDMGQAEREELWVPLQPEWFSFHLLNTLSFQVTFRLIKEFLLLETNKPTQTMPQAVNGTSGLQPTTVF